MTDLTTLAFDAADQIPVAELHGAVCGLAVCHGEGLPIQDLMDLVGVEALTDQHAVEQFVGASITDLQADDMSFAPLLPGDDTAMEERLEALGQWCGSFLAGLAAGLARHGVGSLDDCPEQVRELVRDFAAIAQVDPSSAAGGDGDDRRADAVEADFVELEEFVKVGALLMMSSLGPGNDTDDTAQ